VPFSQGDRFVSLGLDWDTLDMPVLYRLKRRLGLDLTLVCYDTIPILYPHLAGLAQGVFTAYFADMAWCADRILCISEHTRQDCEAVLRELGAPVPPTRVIRLGAEVKGGLVDQAPQGPVADGRPFVLFVSTIERRKNHDILYRAWVRLRERGQVPYRLVFVGMPAWGVTDLMNDLRQDPRVAGDIICLDRVNDAHLCWLYRNAAFTVFPSLYEGWGLPVVESLAWGKFCLASGAASLPEAGGDWVEYLDPWDLEGWTERLGFFMHNPAEVALRNERIAREFVAPAWADTARQIHEAALGAPAGEGA
jgi:glycosyltransferase involved in cell wall biosynthesis